jgi:hypothetical protein
VTQVAALVLLVFGLLPIANWIPGGHDAPWYGESLAGWLSGGGIVLGVGIIAAIALRRRPGLWRPGIWAGVAARWRTGNRGADASIAAAVFVVCAVVARLVFSGRPLLIDEVISLYQARIFASGRLWLPAPAFTEFTSALLLLDGHGKVFGQFPAGGPAMLAVGTLLHAEWLVGPAATAIGAYLFARLLRRMPLRDGTAFAALLLYAFAPFTVFLGGSMMNHVTETTWLLGAALGLSIATGSERANPRAAFVMGLAFGIAAAIRPTDAAAFALPAAGWLLWRARRGVPHARALLLSGLGVAIPLTLLLLVNARQTGSPFRFGYVELWGKSHELGFHAAPWGEAHTPARGLELINLYFLHLQDYFLESAGPGLMFAIAALGLALRPTGMDRWVLAGSAFSVLAYFAYWHDGFYLGPRFLLPLTPWLALWTARLPAVMEWRRISPAVIRGTVIAGCVALLIGAVTSVPLRAAQYRHSNLSKRFNVDSSAAANGVHDALVLVREWWGGQMVARMWSLAVSRTDAEHYYRWNDACRLQSAITATERDGSGVAGLQRRLAPLRSDSARLVTNRTKGDSAVRVVPGGPLTEVCLRRMAEDSAGFTVYPSVLLARGHNNIYLRDLHARDTVLHLLESHRPIWLLTQAPEAGAPLHFERIPVDSMLREWQRD